MRRLASAFALTLALGCSTTADLAEIGIVESAQPWFGKIERFPYLIAVSDSSAVVRWRTTQPQEPALRFWGEGDTIVVDQPAVQQDHTVLLRDLDPSTTYHYQVQIDNSSWTATASFSTFPEPGSREPFSFIAFGDSGTRSRGQLQIARHLNNENALLAIHMGDMAYENGTDEDFTRKHFNVYAPFLSRTPFFPAAGNHDLRTRLAEPFINAFSNPQGWPSGSPFYYAFTVGNVRFIAIDTNADLEPHVLRYGRITNLNGAQYRWLADELEGAQADPGIDWTILYSHHAPYSASSGWSGHGSVDAIRDVIAPLADRFEVPVMFSGHDHDYQRSHPIRGDEVAETEPGTVYIVTGGGGGRWRFRGVDPEWFTAVGEQVHHYIRGHVDGPTMILEAVDTTGNIIDTVVLTAAPE